MALILATLLILPAAGLSQDSDPSKDPPKITLEKSGDFHDLLREVETAFGVLIPMSEEIEKKKIKVAVRDAGFFEALDALCRSHGGVVCDQSEAEGHDRLILTLKPGLWREYPTHYSGHFKTIVAYQMRIQQETRSGREGTVQMGFRVFVPPWHDVILIYRNFTFLRVDEIVDPQGHVVRRKNGDGLRDSYLAPPFPPMVTDWPGVSFVQLPDYDLDMKYQVMAGVNTVNVADTQVMRIPLEPGRGVDLPGGTLTTESITMNPGKDRDCSWKIAFSFKPDSGESRPARVRKFIATGFRYEGESRWRLVNLDYRRASFDIDTPNRPSKPAWLELRVKKGRRHLEVPFRFTDLVLKKE